MFSKVLLRSFPNIKKARPRSGEKRQYVYFGISFKERQENSELHPMTIQEVLYIYLTRNIRKEILFINAELHQCCRIKE
jgi:hypothetical protein